MNTERFLAQPGKNISLKDYDSNNPDDFTSKEEAKQKLKSDIEKMREYQDVLYANNKYGLLIIFQALDAAGKDSTIKHVMSGLNPQGTEVYSFKSPSTEELDHDFLWRCSKRVPEKGRIGIFNRSYYEEVLVVRVHPEFLINQNLPPIGDMEKFWKHRFEDINNFEKYLSRNGIVIIKFFLNVSKEEQKKRFIKRIDNPAKNWKFSVNDVNERKFWDDYQFAYQEVLNHTSTEYAPWYIIPADKKWYMRTAVADILVKKFKEMNLSYPQTSLEHHKELEEIKKLL